MENEFVDLDGLGTFWENAKEYIDSKSGSSEVVNGIIEQYKASTTTIDANTFVEFVNSGDLVPGTDTQLSTVADSYYNASAAQIDTNKVFIAHRSGSYLYGVVCTISGTTITAGTDTQLSTGSSLYASAAQIDTDKVFIAHYKGGYLYGMVCTISGTTITAGTDTQLSTMPDSYQYASAVLVDTNKVFVAHRGRRSVGSSYVQYLFGIVCAISGTTITKGTDTMLTAVADSYQYASAVLVDTNKVFIAHRSGSYLYGKVCTISGTTITGGTDTQLSTVANSYVYASAVLVDTDKVFIAHRGGDDTTTTLLYGIVCTISDKTITAGTDTQLSSVAYSFNYASAVLVDTNKVFVAHRGNDGTNDTLYGMVCTISGTTITAGTDTQLSSVAYSFNYASAVLVDTNKVFVAHRGNDGTNDTLYGIVCTSSVTIEASSTKVDGITKTECTTTTAGEVWVLND